MKDVSSVVEMQQLSYELPTHSLSPSMTSYRYRTYRRGRVRRPMTYDRDRSSRLLQAWYPIERRLRFEPNDRCAVRPEDKRVVLGRLTRARPAQPRSEARNPLPEVGWLSVVGCYPLDIELEKDEPSAY